MRINTNISSLVSYNSLARTTGKLEKSIARLSTGLKISNASDDAAGLAISEKMRAQTKGLDRAYQNAQDGISLLQTAEGAIGDIHDALQRMRELSVHAANGAITDDDRIHIQQQVDQLISHINDIATQTQFNKKKLLDGSAAVLWSTDSLDLGIKVSGTLKYLDKLGAVQSAVGNYKITFSETVTGTENIQKSNVLTLKHGTSETNLVLNTKESGLTNLQALNMVEGEWRVETRERPFGGVSFYQNGNLVDKANIKIDSLDATGTPHTVAFGEYDIRVANKVPMMATFDTDVVDGVNLSNLNHSRDIDVKMDTTVSQTGSGATQEFYNDAAGGNGLAATVDINNTTNANVFTRYEVANVDARDTLAGQLQMNESYKTATDAVVSMTLAYNSGTQTATEATFTYTTAASTISYESTWRTTSEQSLTVTLVGTDAVTGDPSNDTFDITIGTGSSLEEVEDEIHNALFAGYGITASHVDDKNSSGFTITNLSSTGIGTIMRDVTVTFSGAFANELNMNRTITAGTTANPGKAEFNTGKDYRKEGSVSVAAGRNITQVATTLNGIDGISASVDGTDEAHIVLTQNGTGTRGNNVIAFNTVGAGNAFSELGISGKTVAHTAGATATGTDVMNGKAVTLGTFSNQSISGVATTLGTALALQAAGATTSAVSKTGELSHFNMVNDSIYNITVSGGVVSELRNNGTLQANRGASSANTQGVYDNVTRNVGVGGTSLQEMANNLNSTLKTMLEGDGITANNAALNKFIVNKNGSGENATITLNNTATSGTASTRYNISIADVSGTGLALDEMWSGNKNAALGSSIVSDGIAFDWTHNVVGAANGAQMADVYAALTNPTTNPSLVNLKVEWTDDPTQLDAHWGTMRFTNESNNSSGDTRRVYQLRNGGTDRGENFLNSGNTVGTRNLVSGTLNLEAGQSGTSNHWQTKDAVQMKVTAQGNYSNGTAIDRTSTVGAAGAAAYGDRDKVNRDWLWEGDAAEAARNAAKLNAQFGNNISTDFFTVFQVADGTAVSNIDKGDSWILFTQAETTAGNATHVSVEVGDSRTGEQKQVTYAFNNGVLSGGHAPTINQMLYQNKTTTELLQHHIDFGANSDAQGTTLQYGERAGAMDDGYKVEDWRMDNNSGVDAWYSHVYYGKNATYHFANGTLDSMIHDITVNRQNNINASIMFYKDGNVLKYSMKGFSDDAPGTNIGTTDTPRTGTVTVNADGSAVVEGIKFDNFNVNIGGMLAGDKFVVNVAAAAKLETANLSGAADNFTSYANIQITGDPFLQGKERTGSTAQYRVQNGKEDGATVNLLGYYVSPTNGASAALGVGYYDGNLTLKMNGGFNETATIGSTDPTTQSAGANIIHTEVNYQGKTQFSAGALVTSAYFQTMFNTPDRVVADFIQGISYSDYKFGYRTDGSYGYLEEPTLEKYSDMNGSLIFDLVEIEDNSMTFRIQGHFIDRNGKEYYAEEEYKLRSGLNTDKDSGDTTGTNPDLHNDEPYMPVQLFADSEFGGIFFDEFKLGDLEYWTVGDRFSVALTASGFQDGISEQDQLDPTKPATFSTVDEIGVFSDNRGTAMPISYRFNDGILDGSTVDLHIYQLSHNIVKNDSDKFYKDQVMDGTLTLSFGGDYVIDDEDGKVDHAATFEVVYGQGNDYGVAHYYSNVEDIAQFWDKNGRYILDGGLETLTIKQGDRETQVNIGQGWEVGELTEALSRAVWNDLLKQHQEGLKGEGELLDMAADKEYMLSKDDMRDIIQFVNTVPGKNDKNSVVGTIVAHSVLSGEGKSLEFYGSVDLQNALGFNTIQQGTDTVFNANVSDAHSGKMVTAHNRVVAGTTSYDLLLGEVGLAVDSDLGITRAVYDEASGTFKLDVKDQFDQYVHLVDNAMTLQIGANEGEDMFLTLGDMSADTLGVASVNVRSREGAARAITMIDNAISRVSYQRAIVGAQINRLEHTMSNLANTSLNLQESRSRIVDANLASEMMNRTKLDIVTQAGAAMLVQANQMGSNILTLLR